MNRRQFLQTIVAVPAIIALPSLLVEEVPEFLKLEIDITEFGNRIPAIWFIDGKTKAAGYLSKAYITEYVNQSGGYTYKAKIEMFNILKLKPSQITQETNRIADILYITVRS